MQEESQEEHDEIRCESALQTIEDVLFRFDETSGGTYSIYDLLSFLVEDLVKEGCCAACIREAVQAAFEQAGANASEHTQDGDAVVH